jgi:hypothetical protein
MEFTICKRKVDLTKEKVEEVLEKLIPETFKGRAKYYIEHEGGEVPREAGDLGGPRHPEELLRHLSKACKILRALGFEVKELKRGA